MLGGGLGLTALGLVVMHGVTAQLAVDGAAPRPAADGVGIGLANPAIANIALGVVPPERSGMASGISNTFRIGGLAVGVAALGAVFQHRLTTSLRGIPRRRPGTRLAKAVASGGMHAAAALAHGRSTSSRPRCARLRAR